MTRAPGDLGGEGWCSYCHVIVRHDAKGAAPAHPLRDEECPGAGRPCFNTYPGGSPPSERPPLAWIVVDGVDVVVAPQATVPCRACGGRAVVSDGAGESPCDHCGATGRVDAVDEVERLRERDRLQRMQSTHHALRDIEERDREHAARVAAEREADGLRRDLAAVAAARDEATAEAEREKERARFAEEWYGVRWERLRDLLRGTDLWPHACDIMANGTDGMREPPTYARTLNLTRFRAEAAEAERDLYRAALAAAARGEALRCDTHYGGVLAMQEHADGVAACDACATGDGREWTDTPHAEAIRRALKGGGA